VLVSEWVSGETWELYLFSFFEFFFGFL
jgi:hypothetical protein